jgi:LysR family transcriptional activator of nhaA
MPAQLNLKHLHYFYLVATSGSVTAAAKALHVTPQTISGQLRTLERQVGAPLFQRVGRRLALTETGRAAFSYAQPMFELGRELTDMLRDGVIRRAVQFKVGVAMVVPKLIAYRILAPALDLEKPIQIICHEAPLENLLADIAVHKLDLLVADAPIRPGHNVRAYNHLLGECGISFFASRKTAARYRKRFPLSLKGAPFLFPSDSSALRSALQQWFDSVEARPTMVAQFEDTALMNAFGEAGAGVFALPTAIEGDVLRRYRVAVVGRTREIKERFYLISPERRLKHPSVVAIMAAARSQLFG